MRLQSNVEVDDNFSVSFRCAYVEIESLPYKRLPFLCHASNYVSDLFFLSTSYLRNGIVVCDQ